MEEKAEIPKRRLGKTNFEATILGLGGEGLLRSYGKEKEAELLINTAIDLGVNYFESARAYQGSESYYGKALKSRRKDIFLGSKSHARDKEGAMAHLAETLENMKTDYLDLWQIHDVRTEEDIKTIFGPGGAIEAFVGAREKGIVRFLGVTGHEDPVILRRCLELFDFDTCLIPVNPAEPTYRCFLDEVVPVASAKDVGIVGMKVYMRNVFDAPKKLLFCYALTQPVNLAVIGCDTVGQLRENASIASSFTPLTHKETTRTTAFMSRYAREIMFYKP